MKVKCTLKNAGAIHYSIGRSGEAAEILSRYHYIGTWPPATELVVGMHEDGGLFGDTGRMIACITYSHPATQWKEEVIELTRLCALPKTEIKLTMLISTSLKWLRKSTDFDLVISYADTGQKHHGGIYQAASWNYTGLQGADSSIIVNGKRYHRRMLNNMYGTSSLALLKKIDKNAERLATQEKHLYWKALSKSGKQKAARLGLKTEPYPKPFYD